jgi:6-phosphogluconolactonase (cycloisomerase 2 family)
MKANINIMNFLVPFKLIAIGVLALILLNCGGGSGGTPANQVVNPVIGESAVLELSSFKLIDGSQNEYVGQISRTDVSITIPSNVSNNLQVQFSVTADVESVLLGGNLISNNSSIEIIESQPIVFKLLGKNASSRNYTITRLPEAVNPDPDPVPPTPPALPVISSFSLLSSNNESYVGLINGNHITVSVPSDVPSAMVASFTTNGSQVKIGDIVQASGGTINDFIDGESIVYTVVGENNQSESYTVTRLSSDHIISEFSLTSFTGESYLADISGNNIKVSIPLFTTAAPMMAKFVTNGSHIEVNGVELSPLGATISLVIGQPVVYRVFAEDGSSRDYTLNTTRDSIGELNFIADDQLGTTFYMQAITTHDDRFIYARSSNGTISGFRLGQTGNLTFIADTLSDSGQDVVLLVSPDSRYLYLLSKTAAKILIYSINGNSGELTPATPQSSIALSATPEHVVITPDGKYLYWVTSTSRQVFMNSLESTTGAITPLSPASFVTESQNASIFVTANSKYAYVAVSNDTDPSTSAIFMYSIESNGQLTPLSPASIVSDVNGENVLLSSIMVSSNDNKYLYKVSNNSYKISSYAINNDTGQLSLLPNAVDLVPRLTVACLVTSLATTADNKLYIVCAKARYIARYTIGSDGYLSLSQLNVDDGFPRILSITNSGKFAHLLMGGSSPVLANNKIRTFGIK